MWKGLQFVEKGKNPSGTTCLELHLMFVKICIFERKNGLEMTTAIDYCCMQPYYHL